MKNRITQRYEYNQHEVDYSFDEFREALNQIETQAKEMYENVDKFNICLASSSYSYDDVYLLITYERDETDEERIKREASELRKKREEEERKARIRLREEKENEYNELTKKVKQIKEEIGMLK